MVGLAGGTRSAPQDTSDAMNEDNWRPVPPEHDGRPQVMQQLAAELGDRNDLDEIENQVFDGDAGGCP